MTAKLEIVTVDQLDQMPATEWQIEGILESNSQVVLYGAPAVGKSFVALDMALSIASDMRWAGHSVTAGNVLYIAAEGSRGMRKRIRAWMSERSVSDVGNLRIQLGPVQIHDQHQVQSLIDVLNTAQFKPDLIVVDTLARCFVGRDENSSQDMGLFIAGAERLQTIFKATVLIIHHTRKASGNSRPPERGHSSLRGAADTMLSVSREGSRIVLRCEKQKDDEACKPMSFTSERVVVDLGASGGLATSIVLRTVEQLMNDANDSLNQSQMQALVALSRFPTGASSAEWRDAIGPATPEKTFNNWRGALVTRRLVELTPGKNAGHYQLTAEGTKVANGLPSASHEPNPPSAMPATTPEGVAGHGRAIVAA